MTRAGWLTRDVRAVARHAYDRRDFAALPILADALAEAGCNDEAVLTHCRRGGEYVRGCWVLDGVLGKERAESALPRSWKDAAPLVA